MYRQFGGLLHENAPHGTALQPTQAYRVRTIRSHACSTFASSKRLRRTRRAAATYQTIEAFGLVQFKAVRRTSNATAPTQSAYVGCPMFWNLVDPFVIPPDM